ncbi:MAG: hypothetical protein HQ505_09330 [Nitrosopumilus sp.]|nr:hypothetical protein [Nitrosopumilus sp.]
MALESRRLIFSQEELISAALDYCHHDRIALPDAEIERVEFVPDEVPSLILSYRVSCPMEPDQVVLSGEQLIDAIARFCKRKEIPLPQSAKKRVQCEDGEFVLQFEMSHRIQCAKVAAIS